MSWRVEGGRIEATPADVLASLIDEAVALGSDGSTDSPPGDGERRGVVAVTLDLPAGSNSYDYSVGEKAAESLQIGSIVRVPLGPRRVRGWVTGFAGAPRVDASKLRSLHSVLGDFPVFNKMDLAAARLAARYYMSGLYRMLRHHQPPGLPRGRTESLGAEQPRTAELTKPTVRVIEHGPGSRPLDELVRIAQTNLEEGLSTIVVASEAAPDVRKALHRSRSEVVDITLATGAAQKRAAWTRAALRPSVVLGPRSAVFQTVPNLGALIVLDEESPLLKEQSAPCYRAREIAVFRGAAHGALVLLAGAALTPEARSWATTLERLPKLALRSSWPAVEVVRRYEEPPIAGALSERAVTRARRVIDQGGRALMFLNRAGEARALRCSGCGRLQVCSRCGGIVRVVSADDIAGAPRSLECGRCGIRTSAACAQCTQTRFQKLGAGTAALTREVEKLFPGHQVVRADRESDAPAESAKLIVGTEAAFWRSGALDLVVFVDLDSLLLTPSAFAGQTAFELIARAAALIPPRSAEQAGSGVVLQTYMSSSPVAEAAVAGDPESLLPGLLTEREESDLPPFTRAARITIKGRAARDWAVRIADAGIQGGATCLGPDGTGEEWYLLLLSSDPMTQWCNPLEKVREARAARCTVRCDVDPSRLE